jgi:hypothetical protein
MIPVSTSCLRTSSCPASRNSSASYAPHRASTGGPSTRRRSPAARTDLGRPGAGRALPYPAAGRCRAAAFGVSSSPSSCAEPMCSMFRDPAPERSHNRDRSRPGRGLHGADVRHRMRLRATAWYANPPAATGKPADHSATTEPIRHSDKSQVTIRACIARAESRFREGQQASFSMLRPNRASPSSSRRDCE